MRRHQPWTSLAERLDAAFHNLNEVRPRPVLRGRTAREVFEQDRVVLPDRAGNATLIWPHLAGK
jgi:hypothetical protein